MSNVTLAIRVRPFSDRELKSEKDRTPVVSVLNETTVTITNIKVSLSGAGDSRERVRTYHADYAFDSSSTSDPKYASQNKIFELLGGAVMAAVSRGLPACVLAYGQSATGKTYTMMGVDSQPGLVPRLCAALAAQHQPLTVSFLEIYNERVHDLLAVGVGGEEFSSLPRRRGNARKDLRVREHPNRGPYVQNLRRVVVRDCESLLCLIREGSKYRRTAATRRNASSSRSHALLQLTTPRSTLHLADLAGSEKASWEGCGGGRQKEGANINKSLVALSNVISALVNSVVGKERFVPYRDSALTWLLKDCFTGGAAAFIVATVSPSVACYGESASTLRWAARARQLPAPRTPRTAPQATRAVLQAQLADLLGTLATHRIRYIPESRKLIFDKSDALQLQPSNDSKYINIGMEQKNVNVEAHNYSESTPSSVASGSSEKIYIEKNEVSKDVDGLFGPSLERTRSGSDIIVAPLRNKRRQYRSQEVLPVNNRNLQLERNENSSTSVVEVGNTNQITDKEIGNSDYSDYSKNNVPIYYDSPRAEIVSSVTERLYSKLKKKEEAAVNKMESIVDRRIMEPLSELRICTNARQRLADLSQKAMKNKRKIGIPAYTQTRMRVTRVREQGTDIQSDLEYYVVKDRDVYKDYQNVGTETTPLAARCKEVGIGSNYGYIYYDERTTATNTTPVYCKSSGIMTDDIIKSERSTQTHIVPPPRRKRCSLKHSRGLSTSDYCDEEFTLAPIVSINISQDYHVTPDSTSESDETSEDSIKYPSTFMNTPDLLTNHNTMEAKTDADNHEINQELSTGAITKQQEITAIPQAPSNELFQDEECCLPRVTIPQENLGNKNFENLIMGRSDQIYPYNIVLSPPRERNDCSKKSVKFTDEVHVPEIVNTNIKTNSICNNANNDHIESESDSSKESTGISTDSIKSSKIDSDTFIWQPAYNYIQKKTENKSTETMADLYTPSDHYNFSKYKKSIVRLHRTFLDLDGEISSPAMSSVIENKLCTSETTATEDENDRATKKFLQKIQYFEDRTKNTVFHDIENEMLKCCDRLESAANNYDDFISGVRKRNAGYTRKRPHVKRTFSLGRTPREYLQHLVEVRRNVVKGGTDDDYS